MNNLLVSIIIPVFNEEKYIRGCLNSLINQTFDISRCEIIIVDGGSTDNTIKIINEEYSSLKYILLYNSKRLVTYGINLGIDHAKGDIIIRLDAHAEYDRHYVNNCVYYISKNEADNVGGVAQTKGLGFVGNANAEILSSKFGVGNSKFRTCEKREFVDTVPFGTFKRTLFDKIGKFDVNLPRSEDNDINSRIRMNGGKVLLSPDIKFVYYCRDSLSGLLLQSLRNGNALFITLRRNPKAMSLRHFIPFCFFLSMLLLPALSFVSSVFLWIYLLEIGLYFALDLYFSFLGTKKAFLYKFIAYPLFHLSYGFGSFVGIFNKVLY